MVYTPTGDANINTLGAQVVFDAENPCLFTGRVIANVSGGQFVLISGTNGAIVGSSVNTFVANDITVCPALLYDNVGGIALQNVSSGTSNYVAVARKGAFLVQAAGVVSGGRPVLFNSGGVVDCWALGSATNDVTTAQFTLGRALTCGDSGGYALVALNL